MTIKAEDISEEQFDKIWGSCQGHVADSEDLVDIINAAIEAGVVSPPCWEVVGETINTVTVFKRQEDAARWVEVDNGFRKSEMRHWKGQTE
jgi:hypothetical protein